MSTGLNVSPYSRPHSAITVPKAARHHLRSNRSVTREARYEPSGAPTVVRATKNTDFWTLKPSLASRVGAQLE